MKLQILKQQLGFHSIFYEGIFPMLDKYTHIKGCFVLKDFKWDYVPPTIDKSILKLFIYLQVSISINGAVFTILVIVSENIYTQHDNLEYATCQSLSVKLFV